MLSTTTPSSTNYNYGIPQVDLGAGTVSGRYAANATTGVLVSTGNGSDSTSATFDVVNPFSTNFTNFHGLSIPNNSTGYGGAGSGTHASGSSYNGLQLSLSTGNFSNAAIMVYGYRYLVS
jgi:hypothetical protein